MQFVNGRGFAEILLTHWYWQDLVQGFIIGQEFTKVQMLREKKNETAPFLFSMWTVW